MTEVGENLQQQPLKWRRWWLSALLSLLAPGVGQLYNGEVTKAIVFFIGWFTIIAWPLAVMEAYYSARVGILEGRLRRLGAQPDWN